MKHKQWKKVVASSMIDKEWWEEWGTLEVAGIPKNKITAKIENGQLIIEGHSKYRYIHYTYSLNNHPSPDTISIVYQDGLLLLNY